ncbi:cytochrome P450 [Hyphococcus flavus]|uniref:Cytochrome P450 n=1 Tax=Hyphococcus flavus TaxID=1866326 RepID=A0AAE9ZBW6_9PROT|nr:cytochrome P450 [Hyphococcus flavus]WDI31879.1 cytochrome P450 [Hyphococcus flavus]
MTVEEKQHQQRIQIPFDKGWPLLGMLPPLLKNIIGTFSKMARNHGGLVAFRLPQDRGYLVSDPQLIKEVMLSGEPKFPKGKYTKRMEAVFGGGLITAEGANWRRQRKLLAPIFSNESISKWLPKINEATERLLKQWNAYVEAGASVDASALSRIYLQDVMGEIMFGNDISKEEASKAAEAMTIVNDTLVEEFFRTTVLGSIGRLALTPGARRFRRALHEFNRIVDNAIRNADKGEGDHLIAQFRAARFADTGSPMTEKQFRDEVSTFFFAGQETTANALAWALYFLAKNEIEQRKVAAEARQVIAGAAPTWEELGRLTFTRQVVLETLRLKPPAYAVERRTSSAVDSELRGCPLKKDALVVIAPSVTHMNSEAWPSPEKFQPDRFEKDKLRDRDQYAYIPFGAGARKCIGMNLSLTELTIAIAMITREFEYSVSDGAVVSDKTGLTLRPFPEVPLTLRRRSRAGSATADQS